MDKQRNIINSIKNIAASTLPPNSALWLFGSRARNEAHHDSDWDLLILLDKPELEASDYGLAYPFREFGWEINEEINPSLYTKKQWDSWTYLPFYKNVEHDKVVLL